MFHGLGVFYNFISLLLYSFFLALVLLLVRLYFHFKKIKNLFKTNFVYVFSAIIGVCLFLNSEICVVLNLISIETEMTVLVIGLFLISLFMLLDIYKIILL